MQRTMPWFIRLSPRALARRDAIERASHALRRARGCDPGEVLHAFAFKCDELGFARALLDRHPRYWLFRTHQQRRCGDFAAVDMSPPDPARRVLRVLELKRAEPVRVGRGGLQLAHADTLREALAAETGVVCDGALVERATGDMRELLAWLVGAPARPTP